jgi:bifunctional DNA-binding transcriptional regulator/antitoxin component of YhaV-PrlF toxin-antitoxin module
VTLSESVRKHLGVEEGDVVLIELGENGTAEIIAASLVPRDQVWFLHPEMQHRIAEAHDDVAAGRTTAVTGAAALHGHLERTKKRRRSA